MSGKSTKHNFWTSLPKHFSALAPMEDVTDAAFRRLLVRYGRPDVFFTEFTSVSGLNSPEGRESVSHRLLFDEDERPIVVQIWGKDPDEYYQGVRSLLPYGFDGIDINMGCPVKKIIKQGCCSALINDPTLASEIIDAVREASNGTPVSVKTRIGFDSKVTERWAELLLGKGLSALTVHGRIAEELSKYPADWDEIKKVVDIRNATGAKTLVIGNGDIDSLSQGKEYCIKYGVDGYMIGRGIFKDPWIFNPRIDRGKRTSSMRIDMLIDHLNLYEEIWEDTKNLNNMRKFFKMYIKGFDGAPQIRSELMGFNDIRSMVKYLSGLKHKMN